MKKLNVERQSGRLRAILKLKEDTMMSFVYYRKGKKRYKIISCDYDREDEE